MDSENLMFIACLEFVTNDWVYEWTILAALEIVYSEPVKNGEYDIKWKFEFFQLSAEELCLQCFDAVGWAAGRASGL